MNFMHHNINAKHDTSRRVFSLTLTLIAVFFSTISYAKSVLILGDSISAGYGINPHAGWVALLEQKLLSVSDDNEVNVINASVSGNTSSDGLARLPKLIEAHTPDIIVVELGGNDGLRGHPLKVMESNLNSIIALGKNAGSEVILAGIEIPPNYGQRYTDEFKKVFVRVAEKNDVPFIPFILEGIALEPELMQDDGIHPTEDAQPLLLENIWPSLKEILIPNLSE
ncbi:arylesterase [Sessilibacter corallicola]|uniref:arylesterase n=1 Tax=Sessilibacter corallicola TaxID=2904075 RepID=UPI001E2AFCE0|nr:arylesterase [Sessilibacter corallicola]MCE2028877.1 arylesterase [Sessilibacter corallicola]